MGTHHRRGEAVGSDDKATILKLARAGLGSDDIARRAGWAESTVLKVIRERHNQYARREGVFVVYDPSGLFRRGSQFTMLDLSHGLEQKVWADGMMFRAYDGNGAAREVLIEQGRAWDVNAHEVLTWRDGPHRYRWARGDDAEGMATAS